MASPKLSAIADERSFDAQEVSLIGRALSRLSATSLHDAELLSSQVERLSLLGEALTRAPSLYQRSTLGNTTSDTATLVARLSHLDPFGGELALPEKALLGRAFLNAKISLLRAFCIPFAADAPASDPGLAEAFRAELAQSIYTAIATEILCGLLSDREVAEGTRARAAEQLILIWERAAHVEIDDFCPLLESAWGARSRVSANYGALLGTAEYLRLVQEDCSEQFLAFFTRDNAPADEKEAFEEFLFGLPYEEITKLRETTVAEHLPTIDPAGAARILARPLDQSVGMGGPEALYRCYRRRLFAAECRRWAKLPGPRRVAEAYLMIFLLEQVGVQPREPPHPAESPSFPEI